MSDTVRLTMAQALVRHLAALRIETDDGRVVPYCAGVWAIFGHGNVAGLGEALAAQRDALPTYRAHNEQAMAHAAIAFAKAHFRQRIMAVTTSIGPGATNLVTAAATAHVNRLPVLLLPGDVFASRAPDPVLQQVEDFAAGDISANDAFRPLLRYFDRLTRPEQILTALPRAVQVMTDPATCGPVCLALPQDVQTMAFDCPASFLEPAPLHIRRPAPDARELAAATELLCAARRPLVIAGGGVLYSRAGATLAAWATAHGVPVAETQAGKGSLAWDHPLNVGAHRRHRLAGGQRAGGGGRPRDRHRHALAGFHQRLARPVRGRRQAPGPQRAAAGRRQARRRGAGGRCARRAGARCARAAGRPSRRGRTARSRWPLEWNERVTALTTHDATGELPYDAEVIGAVRDSVADSAGKDIVVCAAGTLPAELHKLWRTVAAGGYHVEYGYSCMGYEIAGGLGVKMARPEREVIVMVGDGSYLMLNSEIATSVMLGLQADRRRARQPRLRLHPAPAARRRAARASTTCSTTAWPKAATT